MSGMEKRYYVDYSKNGLSEFASSHMLEAVPLAEDGRFGAVALSRGGTVYALVYALTGRLTVIRSFASKLFDSFAEDGSVVRTDDGTFEEKNKLANVYRLIPNCRAIMGKVEKGETISESDFHVLNVLGLAESVKVIKERKAKLTDSGKKFFEGKI
jgi:hypothetical protein